MIRNRLIIYDITDYKRLQKIAKIMENYGTRVQKSVFEIFSDKKGMISLQSDILDILDEDDSVIFFELCQRDWGKIEKYGPGKYIETKGKDFYIV